MSFAYEFERMLIQIRQAGKEFLRRAVPAKAALENNANFDRLLTSVPVELGRIMTIARGL